MGVILGIQTLWGWKVLMGRQIYTPTQEQKTRAQQAEAHRQAKQPMTFQQQVDWAASHLDSAVEKLLADGVDRTVIQVVLMGLQDKHSQEVEQDGSDTDR